MESVTTKENATNKGVKCGLVARYISEIPD